MIKTKGNAALEVLYPDEFLNQCIALKNTCSCGVRFVGTELTCQACGAKRTRCQKRSMANEDTCPSHAHARPYSLYSRLASTLSDAAIEEFIEKDNLDLTQEFALARLALSGILEKQNITSEELMTRLNEFFTIAQKKKKIEEGHILKISWNDDLFNSLKKRWRLIIREMETVLKEELQPELFKEGVDVDYLLKKVFTEVKERSKMLGNQLTLTDLPELEPEE